jgi:hypothetical protein
MAIEIVYFNDEKYVWAKTLYSELGLNDTHYARNVNAWISTKYLFQNTKEYKFPVENYHYYPASKVVNKFSNSIQSIASIIENFHSPYGASEKSRGNFSEDYLLHIELAKLITVNSKSKLKDKLIQWLLSLESKVENFKLMSQEMILGLLEISKFCTYIDSQLEYYKNHKAKYFEFKEDEDDWKEFDQWRNSVLKLDDFWRTRKEYDKIKQFGNLKTKIERIAMMDSLTSIRNSLFDFLAVALAPYTNSNLMKAKDLANFVKSIYETIGIKRIDILPRNHSKHGTLDMFEKYQDIDFMLVHKTINEIQKQN